MQTAELLKEINRDHTVVVVEHDMAFVRELGVKVTCLHEGSVLAEGTIDQVSTTSAWSKCIWDASMMLRRPISEMIMRQGIDRCSKRKPSISTTARRRRCAGFRSRPSPARSPACSAATASARPACSRAGRPASGQRRHDHLRGRATSPALRPPERARRGIAYVPQGREIFPLLTVEENLETGFAPLPRDERTVPDDVFSLFPVLQDMLRPARRRPLRRPAAATGDRPRAGDAAAAAAARRADRRHPALDHQGYRPRHRLSAVARKMAIVLVEQYLDFARELGDHLVVMDRGAIVYSCDASDMDEAALKRALAI